MNAKKIIIVSLAVSLAVFMTACGKKKAKISAKSKSLFKKVWTYDAEAKRLAVAEKAGKATGIKNLKDVKLTGDVGKAAKALSHTTLQFGADTKGRGVYYIKKVGTGFLQSKEVGWVRWNADETEITFEPPKNSKKPNKTYKVVSISGTKLVLLDKASTTDTPDIYVVK